MAVAKENLAELGMGEQDQQMLLAAVAARVGSGVVAAPGQAEEQAAAVHAEPEGGCSRIQCRLNRAKCVVVEANLSDALVELNQMKAASENAVRHADATAHHTTSEALHQREVRTAEPVNHPTNQDTAVQAPKRLTLGERMRAANINVNNQQEPKGACSNLCVPRALCVVLPAVCSSCILPAHSMLMHRCGEDGSLQRSRGVGARVVNCSSLDIL